jgi:hypothetical protein
MVMTNASRRPNNVAATPSIGAEISAWDPSRVAGTLRRTTHTASTTTPNAKLAATIISKSTGTVLRIPRSMTRPYPRASCGAQLVPHLSTLSGGAPATSRRSGSSLASSSLAGNIETNRLTMARPRCSPGNGQRSASLLWSDRQRAARAVQVDRPRQGSRRERAAGVGSQLFSSRSANVSAVHEPELQQSDLGANARLPLPADSRSARRPALAARRRSSRHGRVLAEKPSRRAQQTISPNGGATAFAQVGYALRTTAVRPLSPACMGEVRSRLRPR